MSTNDSAPISGNTQYNDNNLFDNYSKLCPPGGITPSIYDLGLIEAYQMELAVTDPSISIAGKRILDLACGNGYYSSKHLKWGAASVTGLDISREMLEVGKRDAEARNIPESQLRFMVGDAMDPDFQVDGAPFDMVTASWLLNYAPNKEVMTRIWKFVGNNVKPGGCFVGLTIPPLLSGERWEGELLDHMYGPDGIWGKRGNGGKVLEAMPNGTGYKVRTILTCEGIEGAASFENYHLRLKVFEEACEVAGMFEGVEWRDFVVPDDAKKGKPVGYWNDFSAMPNCRVCVAKRR